MKVRLTGEGRSHEDRSKAANAPYEPIFVCKRNTVIETFGETNGASPMRQFSPPEGKSV
jgi:hypothetical protein